MVNFISDSKNLFLIDVFALGQSSLHYSYYSSPQIQDIAPKQAFSDQVTLLTVTSAAGHNFNTSNSLTDLSNINFPI